MSCKICGYTQCICHSLSRYESVIEETSNTCVTECNTCSQTPCSCTECNKIPSSKESCSCTECATNNVSELGEVVSDCSDKTYEELQNNAPVFVYENDCIHINTDRGITGPLVLGQGKLYDVSGMKEHLKQNCEPTLVVDGDVYISGIIYNKQNTSNNTKGETCHNTYVIKASDNIDILYVNPSSNPIVVVFEVPFPPNYKITIKDVSLNHPTSYDVYIKIEQSTNLVQLQHYNASGKLMNSYNGIYVLDTAGGAVTYRYYKDQDTFVIENQFMGNDRVKPGLTFG
jgi:hypothetical protein